MTFEQWSDQVSLTPQEREELDERALNAQELVAWALVAGHPGPHKLVVDVRAELLAKALDELTRLQREVETLRGLVDEYDIRPDQ